MVRKAPLISRSTPRPIILKAVVRSTDHPTAAIGGERSLPILQKSAKTGRCLHYARLT